MTKKAIPYILSPRLIQYRPDALNELLHPLLDRRPVWLKVEDKRLPKKTRKYGTLLHIGFVTESSRWLLIAMPPYGAELIDPAVDLKAVNFARLGLSFSLSSALVSALKKLLWR